MSVILYVHMELLVNIVTGNDAKVHYVCRSTHDVFDFYWLSFFLYTNYENTRVLLWFTWYVKILPVFQ